MRAYFVVPLALVFAQPADAETVKSQFTAPNGVVVDVASDDFAGRKEYSSPWVDLNAGDGHGKAMVGEVFNDGKLLGLTIQGLVFYSGDWRFYSSAIFRGGEPAKYHRMDGNVSGCSEYGCSMSESFIIDITREEARSHADGGALAIQLRSDHGQTALVNIPLAYIDAVATVAGEPAASDTATQPSPAPAPASSKPSTTVAATPATKKPPEPAHKKPAVVCITCPSG